MYFPNSNQLFLIYIYILSVSERTEPVSENILGKVHLFESTHQKQNAAVIHEKNMQGLNLKLCRDQTVSQAGAGQELPLGCSSLVGALPEVFLGWKHLMTAWKRRRG